MSAVETKARKQPQAGDKAMNRHKLICVFSLLLFVSMGAVVSAQEKRAPAPKPDAAEAVLKAKLKQRATAWMLAREGLVIKCPECGGEGWKQKTVGRRIEHYQCSRCSGERNVYSAKQWDRVTAYRSPAWRSSKGAREREKQEFAAFRMENAAEIAPKSYSWVSIELANETHGITNDRREGETYWIFATQGKEATWFLWNEAADGPWPDPAATMSESAQSVPSTVEADQGVGHEWQGSALLCDWLTQSTGNNSGTSVSNIGKSILIGVGVLLAVSGALEDRAAPASDGDEQSSMRRIRAEQRQEKEKADREWEARERAADHD